MIDDTTFRLRILEIVEDHRSCQVDDCALGEDIIDFVVEAEGE